MNKLHLSFDVWGTLITNNPDYIPVRNSIISKHLKCSYEEAQLKYKQVKKLTDKLQEETGNALHARHAWIELCKDSPDKFTYLNLMQELNQAWTRIGPIARQEDIRALQEAFYLGHTLSITSNTSMTSGEVLGPWLVKTFGDIFTEMNFSDVVGKAKPNPELLGSSVDKSISKGMTVIHFGDSLVDNQVAVNKGIICSWHKFQEEYNLPEYIRDSYNYCQKEVQSV